MTVVVKFSCQNSLLFFTPSINLNPLSPKSALLGFLEDNADTFLIKTIFSCSSNYVFTNTARTPLIFTQLSVKLRPPMR